MTPRSDYGRSRGRTPLPRITVRSSVPRCCRTGRGLADEPFRAPEADELADLKLGPRELAAAVRVKRLTRIADGVVLGLDAFDRAAAILKTLPQPFTVSQARQALGTTRRVAVPLLEHMDALRITRRADDGTRTVV